MKEINPKDSKENVVINHKLLENINKSLDSIDKKIEEDLDSYFERNLNYLKEVKRFILALSKDKYMRYIYNVEFKLNKFNLNSPDEILQMDKNEASNLNSILGEIELSLNDKVKNEAYFKSLISTLDKSLNVPQKIISESTHLFDGIQGFYGYSFDKAKITTSLDNLTHLISRDEFFKSFIMKLNITKNGEEKSKSKGKKEPTSKINDVKLKVFPKNDVELTDEIVKLKPDLLDILKEFDEKATIEDINENDLSIDLFEEDKAVQLITDQDAANWNYFIGMIVNEDRNVTFKIGFDENGFLYDTRIDYKSIDYKSEHIYGNIKKFNSSDDIFSLALNRNNLNEVNLNLSKNGNNLGNKKILETNGKIRFFILFNKYEVNKYSINFTELKKSY